MGTPTADLVAMEKKYVLQTYSRPEFVITGGEGSWLYGNDGTRYLDLGSGIAVNALGHGHPIVKQAIQEASEKPIHLSNLYHIEPMTLLARDLCESCFADQVFFCNSGSEAVEGALKFARKYTRVGLGRDDKHDFVAFEGSFHGRSMGALSITATEKYRTPYEPLIPGVSFVKFNDSAAATAAITDHTCAVIVEPVQGEGGVTPAKPEFLVALRKRCDETGTLLIFDEIQCGIGRTGNLWAHQGYDVTPDIMTVAKPIAGGLPMGAILMVQKVAEVMKPGDQGSTFGGGPFVSHVALNVFGKINSADFLGEVQEKSERLEAGLRNIAENSPLITAVRGKGLMWGLVTTIPAGDVVKMAIDHNMLILVAGANVVRLLPPLTMTGEEIDFLVENLTKVFSACAEAAQTKEAEEDVP